MPQRNDVVTVDYKFVPIAIEDALHLYLTEEDLARIIATLLRDPTQGKEVKRKGCLAVEWREFDIWHNVHYAPDRLTVHILRIKRSRRRSQTLREVPKVAGRLAEAVIRRKLLDFLDELEGED